jgi:TolA-binding protein
MAPIARRCAALVTLLLLAAGCNSGKAPAADAALAECRHDRDALRAESLRLQEALSRSQSEATELQSRLDQLKIKNDDLAQWAQEVAARFGQIGRAHV